MPAVNHLPTLGDRIFAAVAAYYEIDPTTIPSKTRTNRILLARHMSAWLRNKLDKHVTHAEIGLWLGGRDRTTVINSLERADAERERDPEFRTVSDAIFIQLQEARALFVAANWPTYENDIMQAAGAAVAALSEAQRAGVSREAA